MEIQFNLTRDLVFFDVETTGLNVIRDRILQIALIKYPKGGGKEQELTMLINPGIPISEESMSIHGITPKDLANKPTFQQVSKQLFDFIGNGDLGGYNAARFDIPMLMEEFARVGIDFDVDKRRIIDVQRIFYKMEPRTLKAALKFYCQKDIEARSIVTRKVCIANKIKNLLGNERKSRLIRQIFWRNAMNRHCIGCNRNSGIDEHLKLFRFVAIFGKFDEGDLQNAVA